MEAGRLVKFDNGLATEEEEEYEKPLFVENDGLEFTKEILGEFGQGRFCIQCSGCHGCR